MPRTSYIATQGTVTFTSACADGIAGTLTDVVLSEVDIGSGTVIEGGCTQTLAASLTFNFGSCPP
jgi:hypothetical protein